MATEVYYSPEGNPEVWEKGKQPEGFVTAAAWLKAHPPQEPEFNPGPDYEKRGDDWWKVRFTPLEWLLLFTPEESDAIEDDRRPAVRQIWRAFNKASSFDLTDTRTQEMVGALAMLGLLTSERVAGILAGVPYVAAD